MAQQYIEALRKCAEEHGCPEGYCSRTFCRLPIKCEDCGWKGQVKNCIHTYHKDGTTNPDSSPSGEVEPVDECPECGSDNLWEQQ